MKLVTYKPVDNQFVGSRVGVIVDAGVVDVNYAYAALAVSQGQDVTDRRLVDATVPDDLVDILTGGQRTLDTIWDAVHFVESNGVERGPDGERVLYALDDVKLLAPIRRPGKILAAGKNYADHVAETASSHPAAPSDEKPIPRGFVKVSSVVVGPNEPVVVPSVTEQLDYEVELALVIGKKGRYISRDHAYEYIAGYTVLNDISARDIQFEESAKGNHLVGKNIDGFAPMGPWLVTKDEIPDPMNLKLQLTVNGEVRQDANTSTMIFDIPALIERWSWMTLEPGDVIATGTPAGGALSGRFPYLKPTDVMEASVEGLGSLRTPLIAE